MKKILIFLAIILALATATSAQGTTKANKYLTATWSGDFFTGGLWYRYFTMQATGTTDVLVRLDSDGSTWQVTQNETGTRYVIDPINMERKETITLLNFGREIKLVLAIPKHTLCINCVPPPL